MNSDEGLYIMHTRELHTLQLEIYKIGRSNILDNRMKQYPKGSKIICMINCENSILCEKELIKIFKSKFIQRLEYGTEYFEGDKRLMMKEIFNFINSRNDDSIKKDNEKVVKNVEQNVEQKVIKNVEQKVIKNVEQKVVKNVEQKIKKKAKKKVDINSSNKKINRICPKCKSEFKYPSFLKRHLEVSSRCSMTIEEIKSFFKPIVNSINCIKCNKIYSRKSSLNMHQK